MESFNPYLLQNEGEINWANLMAFLDTVTGKEIEIILRHTAHKQLPLGKRRSVGPNHYPDTVADSAKV